MSMDFDKRFKTTLEHRTKVEEIARIANQALAMQQLRYREDEQNICPNCGADSWYVGRITAECAVCETPMEIAAKSTFSTGLIVQQNRHIEPASRGRFVNNGQF